MIQKRLIAPGRLRRIPAQFSWIDHRLVRERHIESCSHAAAALYLFLLTVGDHQGLSYYSEPSLMSFLQMDAHMLDGARQNLIRAGLVAFDAPLYQVLSLEPSPALPLTANRTRQDCPVALGTLFKQIMGEGS